MAPRTALVFALIAILALFATAGVGVYHAGVEQHWWQGPQACSGGAGLTGTLPDLSNLRVIRCDQAALRILGLSLAGWNALISLLIAGIALAAARRKGA